MMPAHAVNALLSTSYRRESLTRAECHGPTLFGHARVAFRHF